MKKQIIEQLLKLIQAKGYSEMTLACIAQATGLKKSSIYHFFPNGKAQIALEIISFTDQMLTDALNDVVAKELNPVTRLHKTLDILSDFYQNGSSSCLLDVMTIANGNVAINRALNDLLSKLINTFTLIFLNFGFDKELASNKAIEAVSLIQGSLVLSRVSQENHFFQDAIKHLKNTAYLLSTCQK